MLVGENSRQFTCMLICDSMAEREKRWIVFPADLEWKATHTKREKDGPLVKKIGNHCSLRRCFPQ